MSDNIDYAELDKAVNEAIKGRSTGEAKSVTKPVARPTTQSVATKRVARPSTAVHQSHGRFMDFVRKPNSQIDHSTPTAVKPVAHPATQPVATKPVARPVTRPVATKITTAPRPAIVPRSAKIATATKPVRPSIATQIQQKQQATAVRPVAKSATHPTAKPTTRTATKPVAAKATATKPVAKPVAKATSKTAEKAPNANNYSLGVRSPFMTNTKVAKRPLGQDVPETSAAALESTKNIYSSKSPSKATVKKKKHMVTEAPKKHSGWLWTLVVLFVIAAGAGLGYLAYILVFAN